MLPVIERTRTSKKTDASQKVSQQRNGNDFQGKDLCSFFCRRLGEATCDRAHTLNI